MTATGENVTRRKKFPQYLHKNDEGDETAEMMAQKLFATSDALTFMVIDSIKLKSEFHQKIQSVFYYGDDNSSSRWWWWWCVYNLNVVEVVQTN